MEGRRVRRRALSDPDDVRDEAAGRFASVGRGFRDALRHASRSRGHGNARRHSTAARTRAFLGTNLRHWEQYGFGLWIFRDQADGRFVGRGGLRRVILHGRPEVEINYALMPSFWGKGLATKIATASVDVGVGFPSLVAFALPDNHGSRRVMEKLGFRYERDIVYAGLPHVLYRRYGRHQGLRECADWGAQRDGGLGARSRAGAQRDGGLGGRPEPPNFK
jgi:RimJ/RimL family protein N-acetyltransferase